MNFITSAATSEINSIGTICLEMSTKLSEHFQKKNYGKIQMIYCMVLCVSKEFDSFFQVRPLKIYRKEPSIGFEYKLDYSLYTSMNFGEQEKYIVSEYLNAIETIGRTRRIKDFDLLKLTNDIRLFLEAQY